MNLYYVTNATVPAQSAVSIQVMNMCAGFRKIGHEVRLFCRQGTVPDKEPEPFDYYDLPLEFPLIQSSVEDSWLPGTGRYYFDLLLDFKNWSGSNLVYARHEKSLLLMIQFGVEVIFEAHFTPEHYSAETLSRIFDSDQFSRLVTISHELRKCYLETFKRLEPDDIKVAHPAYGFSDQNSENSNRGSIDLPGDGSMSVGFIGGLNAGVEILVKMADECPWADFHLVGGSREWRLDYLKDRARSLDNIFFYGYVPSERAKQLRHCFDVLLAPYAKKQWSNNDNGVRIVENPEPTILASAPMKIVEYMEAGKPIITADFPVIREILTDEETALFCEPDAVQEWVEVLNRLRENGSLRKKLGNNARKHYESGFTWEHRARTALKGIL